MKTKRTMIFRCSQQGVGSCAGGWHIEPQPGGTLDPSEELLAHYTTYVAAWRAADFLDMLIAEEGTR